MPDPLLRPGPDDDAWEALLHQLRQEAARPQPFFYARVRRRLLRPAAPWLPAWLRRPVYAVLLAALVLVVSGDGATAAPSHAATAPPAGMGR